MRRKQTLLMLGLSAILLAGCGTAEKKDVQDINGWEQIGEKIPTEEAAKETEEALMENNETEGEREIRQIYLDFLGDQGVVKTAELFREDDADGNWDGVSFGEYTVSELKKNLIDNRMLPDATMKYAFFDFGKDGVEELILKFVSTDSNYMDWTGIIHYNGSGLDLNAYCEDGYRSYASLYQNGYLSIGGSSGAGAYGYSVYSFDEVGKATKLYTVNEYYASFATSIMYDLKDQFSDEKYYDINENSELYVTEYVDTQGVKICVDTWSSDETNRVLEEELIAELTEAGAEQIDEDAMNSLVTQVDLNADEIEWSTWYSKEISPLAFSGAQVVFADYASDELLANPENYNEYIHEESEYQVKVAITAEELVTDLKIYSLELDNSSTDASLCFQTLQVNDYQALTPKKPLVIGMVFWGDLPTVGISYVDGTGKEYAYGIEMSGADGSIKLVEIEMK